MFNSQVLVQTLAVYTDIVFIKENEESLVLYCCVQVKYTKKKLKKHAFLI